MMGSATYWLCNLVQPILSLQTSVSSPEKGHQNVREYYNNYFWKIYIIDLI